MIKKTNTILILLGILLFFCIFFVVDYKFVNRNIQIVKYRNYEIEVAVERIEEKGILTDVAITLYNTTDKKIAIPKDYLKFFDNGALINNCVEVSIHGNTVVNSKKNTFIDYSNNVYFLWDCIILNPKEKVYINILNNMRKVFEITFDSKINLQVSYIGKFGYRRESILIDLDEFKGTYKEPEFRKPSLKLKITEKYQEEIENYCKMNDNKYFFH